VLRSKEKREEGSKERHGRIYRQIVAGEDTGTGSWAFVHGATSNENGASPLE
jgi:hypothetical protein